MVFVTKSIVGFFINAISQFLNGGPTTALSLKKIKNPNHRSNQRQVVFDASV